MEDVMRTFAVPLSAVAALFFALPAHGQAVWVASWGNDANDCQRPTPCRTFTRAINQLGGAFEIGCADSADFGGPFGVSISRSLTINCEDNKGGVTWGIGINVAADDIVTLKGLDLDGQRLSFDAGINFYGAGVLRLDKVEIRSSGIAGVPGVLFQPNGPAKLVMSNSAASDNSVGNILIKPSNGATVHAIFDRVTTARSQFGIKADGSGQTSGQINVEVRDSVAAHHSYNGFIAASDAGQAQIRYKVTRSTAFGNGSFGAVASGAQAFMIVDNSTLTDNGTGLAQIDGATVGKPGNSTVNFNTTNVAGTITPIAQR